MKYDDNIELAEQTRESRFLLNNYISGEKKKISVNGVEYEVQLFQGDHSNEYLLSEMKDGKVEGRCQLFNRGILCLAWMMKNGKRVGGITEYENGKVLQKENWDSVLGNGDRKIIENTKEGLVMTIRCRCENENEEIVFYRGEFDDEMNRHGHGMEYDRESGKEKIEGYWEKDKLVRIVREFDAENNKMIEYAENSSVEIWSRIPVYIGGYCIENGNQFVRNGVGYLIDETNGTVYRESEWEHGKEMKRVDLYGGWYVTGMQESIRSVLKNENLGEIKNYISSQQTVKPITIYISDEHIKSCHSQELNDLNLTVTNLAICSGQCKELDELDLSKYKMLQSIEIGNDCFSQVKTFKIVGLNKLTRLIIGNNSFYDMRNTPAEPKSFHILNCYSLDSIHIGFLSFYDFGGPFELKNLPSLRCLEIGDIGLISSNFLNSSFVLRGILNDIQ